MWENGTATQLPDLGVPGAVGIAINDQGQIVGQVVSADGTTAHAALWQNGAITNLGTLPGDFGSYASGINNQGQVLGTTFDSSGNRCPDNAVQIREFQPKMTGKIGQVCDLTPAHNGARGR